MFQGLRAHIALVRTRFWFPSIPIRWLTTTPIPAVRFLRNLASTDPCTYITYAPIPTHKSKAIKINLKTNPTQVKVIFMN